MKSKLTQEFYLYWWSRKINILQLYFRSCTTFNLITC